jgi:serine/threonine protein kinase
MTIGASRGRHGGGLAQVVAADALVATDALKGLEYLHTPNPATYKPAKLHRDIKPSNNLMDWIGAGGLRTWACRGKRGRLLIISRP